MMAIGASAFAIFVIAVVVITVLVTPRFHPYWKDKPVSWTTLIPAPRGVIDPRAPRSRLSLPGNLRIREVSFRRSADVLAAVQFLNAQEESGAVRSASHLAWTLSCPRSHAHVLLDGERTIGFVHSSRRCLHTPLHENLPCQSIEHLVIARDRRGQRLCTFLIDRVIARCPDKPSIGFFMSERRMPWAEVAVFQRHEIVLNPLLLPDPNIDVAVRVVTKAADLPTRVLETSRARVEGGETLEPSPERDVWEYYVRNPHHTILSVSGEDWIHLQHLPARSGDDGAPILVRGFSLDKEHVQNYLFAYLRASRQEALRLIVYSSLNDNLDTQGAALTAWRLYDVHYLYFYNYRLNKFDIHVPYHWNMGSGD